jgi:hypothetical protein
MELGTPNTEIGGEPATFAYLKHRSEKWITILNADPRAPEFEKEYSALRTHRKKK